MSRSERLREQAEWLELQQCRGWARLALKWATDLKTEREALESMSPDNVALPRSQGRIQAIKEIVGDPYTETPCYPEKRIREIEDELKGEADGRDDV